MNKKDLSERDICTKYITPAIKQSGWDPQKKKYKDRLDGALKWMRDKEIVQDGWDKAVPPNIPASS